MITDATLELLRNLTKPFAGFDFDFGVRADAAYVWLSMPSDSTRWAVVSSPGDRWFSLDVDGGFSVDHFEEDATDEHVRTILESYVLMAVGYLKEDVRATRVGRLGAVGVRLMSDRGEVVLRRSLGGDLRNTISGRRRN